MSKFTHLAVVAFVGSFVATASIAAPTFKTVAVASPSEALLVNVQKICTAGSFVLSDRATLACTKEEFPRLNKNGDAFVNVGLGAELNALIRNIKP